MAKKRKRKRKAGKYSLKRVGVHPLDKEIDWSICYTKGVKPGDALSPSGLVRLAPCGRNGKIVMQIAGTCTWCGEKVPPKRSTWCSNVCVRAYSLTQVTTLRAAVYTRDKGRCTHCGLDTVKLKKEVLDAFGGGHNVSNEDIAQYLDKAGKQTHTDVVPHLLRRRTFWDMDHIVPVSSGGDIFSLNNLHTLCYWCHKSKTKGESRND